MKTVQIIQLCAGLAAVAALVGADALGVDLTKMSIGLLAGLAGWVAKRPSDFLKTPE